MPSPYGKTAKHEPASPLKLAGLLSISPEELEARDGVQFHSKNLDLRLILMVCEQELTDLSRPGQLLTESSSMSREDRHSNLVARTKVNSSISFCG